MLSSHKYLHFNWGLFLCTFCSTICEPSITEEWLSKSRRDKRECLYNFPFYRSSSPIIGTPDDGVGFHKCIIGSGEEFAFNDRSALLMPSFSETSHHQSVNLSVCLSVSQSDNQSLCQYVAATVSRWVLAPLASQLPPANHNKIKASLICIQWIFLQFLGGRYLPVCCV